MDTQYLARIAVPSARVGVSELVAILIERKDGRMEARIVDNPSRKS